MTTQAVDDKKAATEILQVEVWDILLNKLEDPKDLYASHNSCATFRDLLTKKRSNFLFPMVAPILMDKGLAKAAKPVHQFSARGNRDLDKRVLSLRSVSKFWRIGVNSHFQSWEYFLRYSNDELLYFEPFCFERRENVEKFMEKMTTHTSNDNPFFTGLVKLDDDELHEDNEVIAFWEAVTSSLLPKFGKHILYCELSMYSVWNRGSRGYPVLVQVLSQMPALRFLDIYADFSENPGLKREIRRTPLPDFGNLKSLHVKNTGINVTNELLRAAGKCQFQNLLVDLQDDEELEAKFNSNFWELQPQLPHLEDVSFPGFTSYSSLIKLSNASWSLKKLHLQVYLVEEHLPPYRKTRSTRQFLPQSKFGEDDISFRRLFECLSSQGAKSTIRHLSLLLHGSEKIERDLRLNIPSLEILEIVSWDEDIVVNSLDFLVEMKALKSLSIEVSRSFPTKKNKRELIQFSGFGLDLKKSNIWTVLPNLKYLSLSDQSVKMLIR